MTQKILLALLAVVSIGTTGLVLLRGAINNADYHAPTTQSADSHAGHDHHAHMNHGSAGVNLDPMANKLDDFGRVPEFTFINQNAQPVTLESFKGKAVIAGFIFTRCPGPCPMISAKMSALQKQIAASPLASRVNLVSISVDPEYDTPPVLAKYASNYDKGGDKADVDWTFITGDRDAIWQFVGRDGLGLALQDTPDDPASPILHTTKLLLIGPDGHVRGYYDALDNESTNLLLAHLQTLHADQPANPSHANHVNHAH